MLCSERSCAEAGRSEAISPSCADPVAAAPGGATASELDVHSVIRYLDASSFDCRPFWAAFVEDGIRVVDVNENFSGGAREVRQVLQHAARTALGQMPHVARPRLANTGSRELVVAPKGAIDQHA